MRQYHAAAPNAADGTRVIEVEYSLGDVDETSNFTLSEDPVVVTPQAGLVPIGLVSPDRGADSRCVAGTRAALSEPRLLEWYCV